MNHGYRHVQRSPLCLFLYAAVAVFWVTGLVLWDEPHVRWVFPPVGLLLLLLAASFHHLKIEDARDRLVVSFGPVPCFRRSVRYDNILSVKHGRTTVLDGWGIHRSFRGGWVWNIWGRDCVVLQLDGSILRLGTDDADNLIEFLQSRLSADGPGSGVGRPGNAAGSESSIAED